MTDNIVFKGSLVFLGLADIFQILGGNNSTGTLSVSSKHVPYNGLIYFRNGDPINSTCGSLNGIKAVYSLFGWTEGQFEFHEDSVPMKALIKKNRMEIVLDALRLIDDGEIEKIGPPSLDNPDTIDGEGTGKERGPVVIKGPPVDYLYVVGEETYNDEAIIIREKGYGKWISAIYQGTAIVKRDTINGPMEIVRLGEGAFIGTFRALLFGEYRRNASVYAEGEVQLCSLNAERIQIEYASLSADFQKLLLNLDDRLERTTDRAVALYEGKDPGDEFTKDSKVIIKSGSSTKDLFIIREGAARVVVHTPKGNLPILTLMKGNVFGEIPFLDFGHEPRSASVLASNDLEVDKLDVDSLQDEYETLSRKMKNMIHHVGNCITMTTRLVCHLHGIHT